MELDLTVPRSTDTLRTIVSGGLKRLRMDLDRLPSHRALDAVREVFGREPAGRAWASLRRTNIATMVRVARNAASDELLDALAVSLAVELAHAGASLALDFDRAPARIVCLGGRFVLPGGPGTLHDRTWRIGDRTYSFDGPLERPFWPLAGSPRLVLAGADDNPLAMLEAHPDKGGNAVDLGDRSPETWCSMLDEAIAILQRHLPIVRDELELVIEQIVPVGVDEVKHLSASYREAIGTIYLTLHPSVMTMAEALIHELSHNKLNAAMELDPLLVNAFELLFASPVRPDPRPLHGVLLAVHAFLPVAELYRRMIAAGDPRARPDRFAQIVAGNREGASVLLANAQTTPYGRRLLEEIRRLDASFA